VLDLKGPRRRLAERVLRELEPYLVERRFTVCARWWRLLEPFAGTPVRRIHSVGSARQLRRVRRRFARQRLDGVSIHERLVDRETIASLRDIADIVMAWPVNEPERARALLRLGVLGLITDDVAALSRARVLEPAT
jgi:glycerophosphoryl diester phosphodiesterase